MPPKHHNALKYKILHSSFAVINQSEYPVLPGVPGQDPFSQMWVLKKICVLEKLGVLRPPFFVKRGLEKSEKAKKWS